MTTDISNSQLLSKTIISGFWCVVGKKGKCYEKLKLHARELAEDAEDMAELMGEKDTM